MRLLFRRVGNAVDQAGDIALDRRQRRAQVVRNAGEQLFTVIFITLLRFHRIPQAQTHFIKVRAYIAQLVLSLVIDPVIQIAIPDFMGCPAQFVQRNQNAARNKGDEHDIGCKGHQNREADKDPAHCIHIFKRPFRQVFRCARDHTDERWIADEDTYMLSIRRFGNG